MQLQLLSPSFVFWFTCFIYLHISHILPHPLFTSFSTLPKKLSMVLRQAMINLDARLNRFMQGYNAEKRTKNLSWMCDIWVKSFHTLEYNDLRIRIRLIRNYSTKLNFQQTLKPVCVCVCVSVCWWLIKSEKAFLFDGFFKLFRSLQW